ncbi:MAG TPA: hypothetical protein VKB18_01650 [Gemmatimonadota bacterium]|nr:hypothetical protein [Gemmatimonadota bacterium]
MPSEERVDLALKSLGAPLEAFRSAVARAVDEVRGELERRRQPAGVGGASEELGGLASRLMDAGRFAGLFAEESVLDPDQAALLEAAHDTLASLDAADDRAFARAVGPEEMLRDAVLAGLGRLGAAFGAARAAELAREGRRVDAAGEAPDPLFSLPPASWNRAERGIAPPLVVETPGSKLRAGELAEFVDGAQKLLLVVDGPAPAAALVRLISPGVFVLQTEDPAELERATDFPGPAVAALLPEGSGAARFAHDPAAGQTLAERLTIEEIPAADGLRPVGPISVWQQAEELAQLASLTAPAGAVGAPSTNGDHAPEAGSGAEAAQPADRLAAWLLRQADLRDLG